MAKDPAFLFYPNDWLGGTMGLTRHHKGCYIDLLIAQFNQGPLSNEVIKTVLGQDQAVWTVLQSKFKQNPQGHFYNERLAAEIEKRKNFSDSRRKNISNRYKKTTSVDTSVLHMENEIRNENENPVFEKKPDVKNLSNPLSEMEAGKTIEYTRITLGRKYSKDEIIALWKAFCIQEEESYYPSRTEKVKHFRNWIKTQPYGSDKKNNVRNGSNSAGTSEQRIDTAGSW